MVLSTSALEQSFALVRVVVESADLAWAMLIQRFLLAISAYLHLTADQQAVKLPARATSTFYLHHKHHKVQHMKGAILWCSHCFQEEAQRGRLSNTTWWTSALEMFMQLSNSASVFDPDA